MADIFDEVDQTNVEPQGDVDYFEELVGEGKKFADAKALAKGKVAADTHIQKLEQELASLREKAASGKTVEDLLSKLEERNNNMNQSGEGSNSGTPIPGEPSNGSGEGSSSALDLSAVEKLVAERLEQKTKQEREEANYRVAVEGAKAKWGDNAQVEINRKATQLGLSLDQLKGYARENPEIFLTLVGAKDPVAQTQTTPSVPNSTANVGTTQAGNPNVKNKRYYDNLKKTDPKRYRLPDVQLEMHNEAIRQGDAFFS